MNGEIELHVTRRIHKMDIIRDPDLAQRIAEMGVRNILQSVPEQIAKNASRFVRRTDGPEYNDLFPGGADVCLEVAAVIVPRGEYLEMSRVANDARNRSAIMYDEIRELRRKLSNAKARRQMMRRRGRR